LSSGAYVNPTCAQGTPLSIAAYNGNVRMVELLLKHQANVLFPFSHIWFAISDQYQYFLQYC
jgi:ankyrin repeat protein